MHIKTPLRIVTESEPKENKRINGYKQLNGKHHTILTQLFL